jgi:hypothetical protein
VTLDANGVYSFQFGSAGSSNTQVTETIGTTAGSTLTYTKTLTNTPVVANSITVTDGTNLWSQSVGNPGVGATATANTISGFVIGATITNGGSGYTSAPNVSITGAGTGATATATLTDGVVTGITINSAGSGYTGAVTITIAPPVIPFRVDYSSGAITATYSSAPAAGRTITATYRYGNDGISGALSSGVEHWMAVSIDGAAQGTRQRVLTVPFAQTAKTAQISSDAAGRLEKRLRDIEVLQQKAAMGNSQDAGLIAIDFRSNTATLPYTVTSDLFSDSTGARLLDNKSRAYGYGNPEILNTINAFIRGINLASTAFTPNRIRFIYSDGSQSSNITIPNNYENGFFVANPSPNKKVAQVALASTNSYYGTVQSLSAFENIYYYQGAVSVTLPSSFLEKTKNLSLFLDHNFGPSVTISAEVVTSDNVVYPVTPGQNFDLNGKSAKIIRVNISHPMDPILSQGILTKLSVHCTN